MKKFIAGLVLGILAVGLYGVRMIYKRTMDEALFCVEVNDGGCEMHQQLLASRANLHAALDNLRPSMRFGQTKFNEDFRNIVEGYNNG